MKKLLLFLSLTIWVFSAAAASPKEVIIHGITYRILSTEATVYKAVDTITTAKIPSTVSYDNVDYSVTAIGNDAFYGCSSLTSVTIPNSVSTIGESAFSCCESLTNVTIPTSVTSIEANTFYGCSGLTNITIPNNITYIGFGAFCGCTGLTSITIPNSVTYIGGYVFGNCESLTSIIIPNSVTNIGYEAFYLCTGLTSITIPNSVTTIEDRAFVGCTGLTRVDISDLAAWCRIRFNGGSGWDNPLWSGNAMLYLNDEKVVDLEIPDTIENLLSWTFAGCSSIKTVKFPEGCKTLEGGAFFEGCQNLKEVYLSSTITNIGGQYTFANCPSLESIYCYAMTPPDTRFGDYIDDAFYNSYPQLIILHIPEGTKDLYSSHPLWSQFGSIIEDLPSTGCVGDINVDNSGDSVVVYSLQGIRMNVTHHNELNTLPAGLYIVNGKKIKLN